MSWKVHDTDDVFAELRGLCSNVYRMYDPCEYRYYYDHDCETYECAVEDAAREYRRLLAHCEHQRQELAKLTRDEREERTMDERSMTEHDGVGSSITDELRKYIGRYDKADGTLYDIADRIDEQYYRTCRALDSAWSATSHEVLEQAVDELSDEWVKLPVDADGVPIRIGDELDVGFVARIVITDDEWPPYIYAYKETPNILSQHFCNEVSHHHEPTVEDLLREFAEKMNENIGMYMGEAIDADEWRDADRQTIAEYAAKLRLAKEDA